jgi:hypothetical protein
MNKLAITALLVGGLFQATGCIITTDDGGDEAAFFDVAWAVSPGCPDGGAAQVVALDVNTQQMFTNVYDCIDGAGVTNPVPLGDYQVWVEIRSNDLATLFAQSLAVNASVTLDGETAVVDVPSFPLDDGFFAFTWNLTDGGGAPLSCTDAGSGGVRIGATLADTTSAEFNIYDCEAGEGVTNPLPVGLHTVVVDVMDTNDASIQSSEAEEATIDFGNHLVDLGNFEFQFVGL